MKIKDEMRVIGWDDSSLRRGQRDVYLVGVVFRGGSFMDGMLVTKAKVDGNDATEKIAKSICKSRHRSQLRVIMLDGITMGGFNYVNIKSLGQKTNLPVIATVRKKTDMEGFLSAARKAGKLRGVMKAARDAGEFKEAEVNDKKVYFQSSGIEDDDAMKTIQTTCTRALVPEPLRIAHLIATALANGESSGRA